MLIRINQLSFWRKTVLVTVCLKSKIFRAGAQSRRVHKENNVVIYFESLRLCVSAQVQLFFHAFSHSSARPQPRRFSPCSPTLKSLNTETTEDLSDLCVEFFLATEDTEALFVRDEIFARRQEVWE